MSESSRPLAPLPVRRRLVGLTLTCFLGYVVLMVLAIRLGTPQGPQETLKNLALLSFVLSALSGWRLYFPRSLGLPSLLKPDLDERQRHVVSQANSQAYTVVSTLLGLCIVYLALASTLGWPLPAGPEAWTLIATTVSGLIGALPAALLAWSEPDAPGDEAGAGLLTA